MICLGYASCVWGGLDVLSAALFFLMLLELGRVHSDRAFVGPEKVFLLCAAIKHILGLLTMLLGWHMLFCLALVGQIKMLCCSLFDGLCWGVIACFE